jgi:hypothetical protein
MRKQVDFIVRVFKLGNGANDTWTSDMLNKYTHENYFSKGYEVFNASVSQVFGGEIYFNMNFVKYEDMLTTDAPALKEKVAK